MTDEFTVKALLRLGRAQEKLDSIMKEEFFDDLSKHNPHWRSEYEVEDEKIDTLRRRLLTIQDRLWDLVSIVRGGEDEE